MAERDLETSAEERPKALLANTRCCFCFPCFGSRQRSSSSSSLWERIQSVRINEDKWWFRGIRALGKVREWSEIVAGPRWKTFIRRLNRSRSTGGSGSGNRHGKFQYDPLSYALNFDEGPGYNGNLDDDDHDYVGFRNFSTRYAAVPGPGQVKSAPLVSDKDSVLFA